MKQPPRSLLRRRPERRRQLLAAAALLAIGAAVLTACSGSGSGKAELVWYTNPDAGGQAKVAENCSTDQYTITTQVLPQDAGQQRIQLARRLAAQDSGIDLMSIDPPYTAELADAGYLAPLPQDFQSTLTQQSFAGATASATWKGQLVAAPFWSNTQVLWYRKSFAQKAGLDMSRPVTWDQIIKAAGDNGGTVAVQANKYEGYVVWINALIAGAGGDIASDTQAGVNASIDVSSPAGEKAAAIVHELASSSAAPSDLSVSNEGTAAATFGSSSGAFMVNWTFIWTNYDEAQPEVKKDLGYAMYPETVQGEQARPPYGGINIGVSTYSNHVDEAMAAAECITKPDNQGVNAELTGNMPASAAGYDYAPLKKIYPAPVMTLFQKSLDAAAPRTVTPYWSDISGSLLSTWHPPSGVSPQTPQSSTTFIEDVLHGRRLL
ncbi:extracellular solute-binding protein [Nocardioides panaciterrulae]|uniref:Multiple sugar transport system substrate-binding protein n=1 Tax=Nocardioides panaciterrulae TaxID=661492 RepID=A0A7Y9E8G1_9ACTN|nr:extracellular solute-binding protein [Nocardioides panaciterrulae]NYD42917.1 multiple sugar transport system substrate-binding protein [Nocardioides panaciterrulae]